MYSSSSEIVSDDRVMDNEMIKKLSEGIVSIYYPTLQSIRTQLLEIVTKQESLHTEMHNENMKFSGVIYTDELQQMFVKIRMYKEKLITIKKNMLSLHEQSTKLKKRALKLEHLKKKEAFDRVQKREYEEHLIRKASKS